MIISNEAANERLNNPMNLFNRVTSNQPNSAKRAMSLFVRPSEPVLQPVQSQTEILPPKPFTNPFKPKEVEVIVKEEAAEDVDPVSLSDIVDSSDQKIKLELAHDEALATLVSAVQNLKSRIVSEENPSKLAAIAAQMGKVVDQIRNTKANAAKANEAKSTHYHFYTPEQKKLSDYQVIDV